MSRTRDTRVRAIEGLRMIAALEEYVAGEIDEPGYFGEMAELLRLSASDRRRAVARLGDDGDPGPPPRLRVVVDARALLRKPTKEEWSAMWQARRGRNGIGYGDLPPYVRHPLDEETMIVSRVDLAALTDDELLSIPGIGPKGVRAIREAIAKHQPATRPSGRKSGGHRRELCLVHGEGPVPA